MKSTPPESATSFVNYDNYDNYDHYDHYDLPSQPSNFIDPELVDQNHFMDAYSNSGAFQEANMMAYPDMDALVKIEAVSPSELEAHSSQTPRSELSEDSPRHPQSHPRKKRRNTTASSDSSAGAGGLLKEKNRIAASKCRAKKKLEEKSLEERKRLLEMQNSVLVDSVEGLRSEVLSLKHEVLRHGTCDFSPIRTYIETAASNVK